MKQAKLHGQLFDVVRSPRLPEYVVKKKYEQSYRVVERTYPALIAMYWPDGKPCIPVELYLLDRSLTVTLRRTDGGSLKVVAAHLTHIIRFCARADKQFWDLTTDDFHQFVQELREEARSDGQKKRNGTTIRKVLDEVLRFFEWLQNTLGSGRPIVGAREENPRIVLVRRKGKLLYPSRPPLDTPDPKRPMPRTIRNQLWEAVAKLANPEGIDRRVASRYRTTGGLLFMLEYLRQRRELTLLLLEATGARPGELVALSVEHNENCVETGTLAIPTLKKRRSGRDPLRYVPTERGVAIKVEIFISKYRKQLLDNLQSQSKKVDPRDTLLLNVNGMPMTVRSLSKDHQRLVNGAGVKQAACMSMFRHRFITNVVLLHLIEFVRRRPGVSREIITDADYLTILAKVKPLTGHSSTDSLLHYVDWAWDEMGVFDYVQPAHVLCQGVENSVPFLTSLIAQLTSGAAGQSENAIKQAIVELDSLRNRMESSIAAATKSQPRSA